MAGAEPIAVVIAAWELRRRECGCSPDAYLSPQRFREGVTALELADRWANFGRGGTGAGALLALDLIDQLAADGFTRPLVTAGDGVGWSRHRDRDRELVAAAAGPVRSLAHVLCHVGQQARRWRAHDRARTGRAGQRAKPRRWLRR